MSTLDLLVLGDANPDVLVSGVGPEVRFGQAEAVVDSAALVLGGSGAITAVGAARLGLSVGLCAVVGRDDLGALVTHQLAEAAVSLDTLHVHPSAPTGLSVVLLRADDRATLTAPGTIAALSPEDLTALPDRPARHVHVASFHLMSEEYRAALPGQLHRFRAAGVTTSLDPNWDPSARWDLDAVLAEVDLLLPNEAELLALTGTGIVDAGCEQLADRGCDVAVKRGEKGGLALVDGLTFRVLRPPPVRFVDAVGAGDSFDAGFLAGRLTGRDPGMSLAMAVVAGTLSTAAVGGTAGQPELADVEPWLTTVRATRG